MFGWFYGRTAEGRANRAAVEDALGAEGPVLVTVHGTFAARPDNDGESWWQRGSPFAARLQSGVAEKLGATPRVLPYHWSGANSEFDRIVAGRRLAAVMRRLERKKRPYHLLAHSHGGNVVVEAISRFTRVGRKKKFLQSVTTFGTPYFRRNLKPMSKAFLIYRAMLLVTLSLFAVLSLFLLPPLGPMFSLILLIPIVLLWRSVAPAARNKARFVKALKKSGLDQRWLALWARRDEAIGLLMRATLFKAEFISARGMGRTLARLAGTLAALAIAALPVVVFFVAPNLYQRTEQLAEGAEQRWLTADAYLPAIYFAIGLFFYALPLFFALHLILSLAFRLGPQHASAWFVNRTIVNGIRTGMFGDDANFALKGVSTTPEKVQVVTRELDSTALDGFADEDALEAAKLLYKELIEVETGRVAEADPAGVWARLSDAICHNGYFGDDSAVTAAVDHVVASSSSAAAAAPKPAAPKPTPRPRANGNGAAQDEVAREPVPA